MDPVLYKSDEGNFVRFNETTMKNEAASSREGRPIFDKVLLATVIVPGSRQEAVHEIERTFANGDVRRRDVAIQRFAKQLDAYRAQNTSKELNGTPLDQWPSIDIRQMADLKALGIHTVEALANLSDTGLQKVGMGARVLKDKAHAFLESAKGSAHAEHLAVELAQRDATIAQLQRTVGDLVKQVEQLTDPAPKGKKAA